MGFHVGPELCTTCESLDLLAATGQPSHRYKHMLSQESVGGVALSMAAMSSRYMCMYARCTLACYAHSTGMLTAPACTCAMSNIHKRARMPALYVPIGSRSVLRCAAPSILKL